MIYTGEFIKFEILIIKMLWNILKLNILKFRSFTICNTYVCINLLCIKNKVYINFQNRDLLEYWLHDISTEIGYAISRNLSHEASTSLSNNTNDIGEVQKLDNGHESNEKMFDNNTYFVVTYHLQGLSGYFITNSFFPSFYMTLISYSTFFFEVIFIVALFPNNYILYFIIWYL